MSGLSATALNVLARGASAINKPKDRVYTFDLPGNVPDVRYCTGTCKNAKDLDTDSGGGKWMYDQAEASFGYKPGSTRNNPEQRAEVETRMYASINAAIDAVKKNGKGSSVEWHSQFRSSLSVTRNKEEQGERAKLNEQARLASLPGASIFADPKLRGAVQAIVNVEVAALNILDPKLAMAAKAGLAVGNQIAIIAADQRTIPGPTATEKADTKPNEATKSEQKPLTPLALPLDTDKDGKLVCREIGVFVKDTTNHNKNSYAYQAYVTSRPDEDFHVVSANAPSGRVKFDGCKDLPEGPMLLEAKAQQGGLFKRKLLTFIIEKFGRQAQSQHDAATALGVKNEWHVQTKKEHEGIKDIINDRAKLPTPIIFDPTPVIKE
jgi:hypothetical protein